MNETRVKLLEQNLASFKARMRSAADKDSLRRQIAACEARLAQEKSR